MQQRGVHLARREGVGRAGVDAARAGAAAVCGWKCRCVGDELERGDDDSEQKPGAELLIEEAGVLADPANASALGVLALNDGAGVDVAAGLKIGTEMIVEALFDRPQFCEQYVVIVATGRDLIRTAGRVFSGATAPSVARNPTGAGGAFHRLRRGAFAL